LTANGRHEGLGKACYRIDNYTKILFLGSLRKKEKSRQLLPAHLHAIVQLVRFWHGIPVSSDIFLKYSIISTHIRMVTCLLSLLKLEPGGRIPTSRTYLQILSSQDHNIRWHGYQKN